MSKHAKPGELCFECEEKLKGAHALIAAWFKYFVKEQFPDCHIAWAFRSKEDQDKMVAEGKSRATWPNSKHNSVDAEGKPESRALDLFRQDADGIGTWPYTYYQAIIKKSEALSYKIEWSGNWTGSFKETCHFQMSDELK